MRRFISYQDYLNRNPSSDADVRLRLESEFDTNGANVSDGYNAHQEEHEVAIGDGNADRRKSVDFDYGEHEVEIGDREAERGEKHQGDREGYKTTAIDGKGEVAAKKKPRGKGLGSVFILFLCFAIAVSCAVLMAGGLNIGHLFGGNKLTLVGHKVYCVQIAAPSTAEEAAQIAGESRKKGGGGYVFVSDGLYLVLASAYENEVDCDNVIEKLSLNKQAASKLVLDMPKVALTKMKDDTTRTVIEDAYNHVWQSYQELYELSVKLDTGELTETAVRLAVGKISTRTTQRITALEACDAPDTTVLKTVLTAVATQLSSVHADMDSDATLSRDVKYSYLKILHEHVKLNKNLNDSK